MSSRGARAPAPVRYAMTLAHVTPTRPLAARCGIHRPRRCTALAGVRPRAGADADARRAPRQTPHADADRDAVARRDADRARVAADRLPRDPHRACSRELGDDAAQRSGVRPVAACRTTAACLLWARSRAPTPPDLTTTISAWRADPHSTCSTARRRRGLHLLHARRRHPLREDVAERDLPGHRRAHGVLAGRHPDRHARSRTSRRAGYTAAIVAARVRLDAQPQTCAAMRAP